MQRSELLEALADRICALRITHPARVAIDGIDAAGKTSLAGELADALIAWGRPVIRASVDGFHRLREERYQQGPLSPEGCYRDSFDYAALLEALLLPLGPGGSGAYRQAAYDYRADRPIAASEVVATPNAALVVDGVFLFRPELADLWDFRILVEVSFSVALERAERRDTALFGSVEAVRARYLKRYIPGQRLYFEEARPRERADAIVRNDDPAHPILLFRDSA